MLLTKQFLFPLTPIVWTKNTLEVNGKLIFLMFNILENILFCVLQKKEIHTNLDWHDGEKMMTTLYLFICVCVCVCVY